MGRETRMVPADWEHPKNRDGKFIPLHDRDCAATQKEWDDGLALWMRGRVDDYKGGTKPHGERRDVFGWSNYTGSRPSADEHMPDWPSEQRTHFMMYENTSEGTPISPAFATPEELAKWLVDNGASSFGSMTASYDAWLAVARGGYAPSMILSKDGLRSGVVAAAPPATKPEGT